LGVGIWGLVWGWFVVLWFLVFWFLVGLWFLAAFELITEVWFVVSSFCLNFIYLRNLRNLWMDLLVAQSGLTHNL
jgi:hypothetical protein